MVRRLLMLTLLALAAFAVTAVAATAGGGGGGNDHNGGNADSLSKIKHLVVIYEENHSFDNLYGGWEGVNGLSNAKPAQHDPGRPDGPAVQLPVAAGRQPDLAAAVAALRRDRPLRERAVHDRRLHPGDGHHVPGARCRSRRTGSRTARGCPAAARATSCTASTRSSSSSTTASRTATCTGSDAAGLVMGHYDTRQLPIYQYLHQRRHPHYAIADDFFQGAFGGSFLNHQWLIAAASPVWAGAAQTAARTTATRSSTRTGSRTRTSYPLYHRDRRPSSTRWRP